MKEFLTKDKQNRVKRVSRWIQIKQAYNVTKRNGQQCPSCRGRLPGI